MLLGALFMSFAAASAPVAPAAPAQAGWEVIGRSARDRPIRALHVGGPRARTKVMVVGAVHGNEPAGKAVVARLRRLRPPRGTALWLVEDANPDGAAANARHNAAGVDLNRNFPYRWRPQDGVYESGPGPASEPETQVLQRFIERERPRVTLWYHQALRMVVASDGDRALERLYSRVSGLPRKRLPAYHGTASSWQNRRFPGDSAFVVELPGGPLSTAGVRRHSRAALALARAVAPQRVVGKHIPFPAKRREEMRGYARRHYGIDDYRLRDPQVIVQHHPVIDAPDPELGELPGVAPTTSSTATGRSPGSFRRASCAATQWGSTGRRSGSSTSA